MTKKLEDFQWYRDSFQANPFLEDKYSEVVCCLDCKQIYGKERYIRMQRYNMMGDINMKYKNINELLEYKNSLINEMKTIKMNKNMSYKKNSSITLDDIYHCMPIYSNLYDNILEIYPSSLVGFCSPSKYSGYKKTRKVSIIKNLNKKLYIKIGEDCPICYEKIIHKTQALLTNCGHAFHFECIQNYYNLDYNKLGSCPMCRQDIGDNDNIKTTYFSGLNGSLSNLDKLENFWNQINSLIPDKCYIITKDHEFQNIHNKGMNKNCIKCIRYRKCIC